MKYNIENKIPYVGSVELSIATNSGKEFKLHGYNHELPALSEAFAKALLGYDVSSYTPIYLDFGAKETDEHFVSKLTNPVILTGKHYEIDDSDGFYAITVNALITDYLITSVAITSGCQYYIYLLTIDGTPLTELALTDSSGKPIVAGSGIEGETVSVDTIIGSGKNLIINWKLKLCNISTSSTEEDSEG